MATQNRTTPRVPKTTQLRHLMVIPTPSNPNPGAAVMDVAPEALKQQEAIMKFRKQLKKQLKAINRELKQHSALQPTGFQGSYPDNPNYLENQWAEDTLVAFEREHGEEGEHLQNLAGILVHFAKWCNANGLQWSEAQKLAANLYRVETEGQGQQFSA